MAYINVDNLSKSYGDIVLFEGISFVINKGQKVALIAKNGAGKTTILNIMSGKDVSDTGNVSFENDISIAFLEQLPNLDEEKTVMEEVFSSSNNVVNVIREYEEAIKGNDKKKLQELTDKMDYLKAWDYEVKIKQILSRLEITAFNKPIKELSGGQKKRVALANTLINEPELLIMDEPTNHLDVKMIEWLEDYLNKSKCTLLLVTHDRYFLDRICNEIIEIDEGVIHKYKGNYSYFLEKRSERILNEAAFIDKNRNILRKELEWMRRQPKARTTKAKSRIDSFYEIKEIASQTKRDKELKLNIKSSRLGKKILELIYLNKSFGNIGILKDFSYIFRKNEKIGIVGRNGFGKTSFLNIITGNLKADSGTIEVGETVVYGYYKQEGIKIKEDQRVIDVIKEISEVIELGNNKKLSAAQFLEYFLFPPKMHYTYVHKLSGGEKRRLYLMTVLVKNPNFLILDEPTNDLDILTLNVLEDYLINFEGCVLVVSHDRYFMDKVVDNLFVFEGNGVVKCFPSSYSNYREYLNNLEKQEKKAQREEKPVKEKPTSDKPKKLSYKFQLEYDNLEVEINQLEEEKSKIEEQLASGELSEQKIIDASNRLGILIQQIEEKGDRWFELNEMINN